MIQTILHEILKKKLILILILVCFIKGLLWAVIIPPFQAPDEHHHYAVIQHYAEPPGYQLINNNEPTKETSLFDIKTQNMSDELRKYVVSAEYENACFSTTGKFNFSDSSFGSEEILLRKNNFDRFIKKYPAWETSYSPLYYKTGSIIENYLADRNTSIIERFFAIRFLTVLLSLLFIIVAYLSFRELSFNSIEATILTAIISFQPMFSFICSVINVDCLLFLTTAIFTWAALNMLRKKANFINILLLILSFFLAINTKPSGYFLIPPIGTLLIIYITCYHKNNIKNFFLKNNKLSVILLSLGTLTFMGFSLIIYNKLVKSHLGNLKSWDTFQNYIHYSLNINTVLERSLTYWGNFGCPNVPVANYYIYIIWIFILAGSVGFIFLFKNILKNFTKNSLPSPIIISQLLFLIFYLLEFNLALHFSNVQLSSSSDFSQFNVSIGAIGRYFFPTIIAKFAILAIGISYFLKKFSREKVFFGIFICMVIYHLICLFNYIIPRYYL